MTQDNDDGSSTGQLHTWPASNRAQVLAIMKDTHGMWAVCNNAVVPRTLIISTSPERGLKALL